MNPEGVNNIQFNYPLPNSNSNIYNIPTSSPTNTTNSNNNISKMIKSIPVMNVNRSMHPLLLPNISQLPMDLNSNNNSITVSISNPSVSSINDNNVRVLPLNGTSNNLHNISSQKNLTPQQQQQQQQPLFTTSQSSNLSYSSNTSFSTQTPINITKSYSILAGGDFPKRRLSSQDNSDLESDHDVNSTILPTIADNNSSATIKRSYSTYDMNSNNIINGSAQIVKQPIGPTFYNKGLPKPRKRQRLGPSCDTCRSRKVRCDAKIEVLYEDDRIICEISDKLSYVLKPYEVEELSRTLLRYHELPPELFMDPNDKIFVNDKKPNRKHYRLMKHINKIVLFQPCSSCVRLRNHKRKNSYANKWKVDHCRFSKGLTKNDTNIFNEIHRVTGKPLEEMTVQDFKNTGLVGTLHG
ncbi:hypothetical protein MOUN0_E05336 [Monosporozyma unispora]|nr:hypothetical protein C6P44_000311 [Kazachstania unispora]